MRIAIGAVAILAAVSLGCDSDSAKDAVEHLENAAEEMGEAAEDAGEAVEEAVEDGVESVKQEAKSVKQQLSDDSDDNKARAKKGAGNAADDIKRTFRGLGKK